MLSFIRANISILTTLAWTLCFSLIWSFELFRILPLEFQTRDFRFVIRGPEKPDPRLILIGIDDGSIFQDEMPEEKIQENPGYELLNDYPYPRKAYTLAIEKLMQAEARMVVLDLVLSKESPLGNTPVGKEDSLSFQRVLEKYPNQVVIGADFSNIETGKDIQLSQTISLPNSELLPPGAPLEQNVGYINYKPDFDGFVRRMNPVGWPDFMQEILPLSLDGLTIKKAFPNLQLPNTGEPQIIRFSGPLGNFPIHPFHTLFWKKGWENNLKNGEIFKDKIILIGPTAAIFQDVKHTPFGAMYGVEIHANAMATLIQQRPLRELGRFYELLLISLCGIFLGASFSLFKSPFGKLIPGFLIGTLYSILTQFSFQTLDCFIPFTPVLGVLTFSTATVVTSQALLDYFEKRRVSEMLQRYVSRNVALELIKSGRNIESFRTPQKRTVTVLFSDVRGFTTMAEQTEKSSFVHQLNEYLTAMVKCVFDQDGTLDKFVGDAVMAVFGNPTSKGSEIDALNAVRTALAMREELEKLNLRWQKEGKQPYRIGIGLNHGDVIAGDIGSSQKAEFGVIGDTVNVAARVEGLTKDKGVDILITHPVYELVRNQIVAESCGVMHVKGRSQPVEVYALKSLLQR